MVVRVAVLLVKRSSLYRPLQGSAERARAAATDQAVTHLSPVTIVNSTHIRRTRQILERTTCFMLVRSTVYCSCISDKPIVIGSASCERMTTRQLLQYGRVYVVEYPPYHCGCYSRCIDFRRAGLHRCCRETCAARRRIEPACRHADYHRGHHRARIFVLYQHRDPEWAAERQTCKRDLARVGGAAHSGMPCSSCNSLDPRI